jgi:hypothetical protein
MVSVRRESFVLCLIFVLVSSLLVGTFMNESNGASLENTVHVKNEAELKNAINNTPTGGSTTIAIDNDITLTSYEKGDSIYNYQVATLIIPANKDITLTSNRVNGFYKLIGAVNMSTIFVGGGGVLRLDGVIVTHKSGVIGCGVHVLHDGGMLYLYSGEISGNTVKSPFSGGGVLISNGGTFIMSGGKITDNVAGNDGGGIENYGTFIMSGGEISGNTAGNCGGGVNLFYPGNFVMTGGTISGNTARSGGGVSMHYGEFTLSGGEIRDNTAFNQGGGVYNTSQDPFVMMGGMISGNSAGEGGGIYHSYGSFTMSDGKVTGNTADTGGGVFWHGGTFDRAGGTISGNIASKGNDIYHDGNGGGSSNGNGGSGSGGSGSGGNGGSSNGSDGFGLRDVVFLCVGVAIVVVGVVVCVLFFYFKKKVAQVEAKLSAMSEDEMGRKH